MNRPVIVDLRHVYNPADAANAGFVYSSIGRPRMRGSAGQASAGQGEISQ
jgi:hypothetical protein